MSSTARQDGWDIELGGRRIPLTVEAMILGRDPECDIPLEDERSSWHHLKLELKNGFPTATDLDSTNGTQVDGVALDAGPHVITREAILRLGHTRIRLREMDPEPSARHGRFRRVSAEHDLRIGRAEDNDIVLAEPNVSRYHAEIRAGEPPAIVDLGSRNGVRLGAQRLDGSAPMQSETPVGIGPFSLRRHGREIIIVDERGGLSLRALNVMVQADGQPILHPTSLEVTSGELVAMIGPSGSGKSTLLKCLAGVADPSAGRVIVDHDPLELRLTDVGYVPQSDVVHDRLTVTEALRYAARLRLPSDTNRQERDAAVADVLGELRLGERSDIMVGRLSGGQRKRVACGVELIGKPTMLLLDEPTSGLDPALERRMMLTLRHLADSGRGVIVVTHATSSLSMCDTVAVMGPSGHLLFTGLPSDSLTYFGVDAYDEIYAALDLADAPAQLSPDGVPVSRVAKPRMRLLSGRSLVGHTTTLMSRYAKTLLRDRRTLAVQLGQTPVIALLIALLYPDHLLAQPDANPGKSAQYIFLLVTAALWLGLIGSCREIVKERSIVLRELAVGVRLDAYLLAKAALLFLLGVIQCLLLVAVACTIQPLHASFDAYLQLTGLLIMAFWAAVSIGLVISTLARSVDQATSLIPLLLIPLLLFGGALEPLATMQVPVRVLSDLTISRWAFAGAGHVIGMNERLAQAPRLGAASGYGSTFFSLSPGIAATILAGFTAALLLASAILLARRNNLAM